MVIGEYSRESDLDVNICREKKLTNIRAAGHDEAVGALLAGAKELRDRGTSGYAERGIDDDALTDALGAA